MAGQHQKDIQLVLIGTVGTGKSATGNTILGKEVFESYMGQIPITKEIQKSRVSIRNLNICVVDTPAIEDFRDMEKCLHDGKTVYALVIKIGRLPREDREIIENIFEQYFRVMNHIVIIFTNKNEMVNTPDPETKTLQGWLKKVPTLNSLITSYGIPYVAFENIDVSKWEKQPQVDELCDILYRIDFSKKSVQTTKQRCPVSETNEDYVRMSREEFHYEFGNRGLQVFSEYKQRQGPMSVPSFDEQGKSKQRKKKK